MRSRALYEKGQSTTTKRLLLAVGLIGVFSIVCVNYYVAFIGPDNVETSTASLALREQSAAEHIQHTLPSITTSTSIKDTLGVCPLHVIDAAVQLKYDCSPHLGPGERLQCCCMRQFGSAPKLGEPQFTCLPTLVIAGAQKAGTTALVGYLLYHPEVRISKRKELHIFDQGRHFRVEEGGGSLTGRVASDWHGRTHLITAAGLQALLRVLPSLPYPQSRSHGSLPYTPFITVDASPSYVLGTETAARIYATMPNAQVLVLLRDPVARAYSEWNMKHRRVVSQVHLDDERGMRSVLRSFITCVAKQWTDAKLNVKEAAAHEVVAWWRGTQVDPPPPAVLSRRCMSSNIRGPHLKYIMHMGRTNDGRTAEELTLASFMAILAPKSESQVEGKGLMHGLGNMVKSLGRSVLRGGAADPGTSQHTAADYSPVYQACDDSGACLGPVFGRMKEDMDPAQEESTLSALYASLLNLPHTPGIRQPPYEHVQEWELVAQEETRRITACSALYGSGAEAMGALMDAVRLRAEAFPSLSLSNGFDSSQSGVARSIVKDGTDACWKQGSDSSIGKDYLYRSVYAGQIMRLYAAFHSSLGQAAASQSRSSGPLVFADTILRRSPQVVLDAIMAGTGLSVYSFTDISQGDLDRALDAAFPTFENNGWMLDSRSSPLYEPMAPARQEQLQQLYAPFNAALLDVLTALGVRRLVLDEVASWSAPGRV